MYDNNSILKLSAINKVLNNICNIPNLYLNSMVFIDDLIYRYCIKNYDKNNRKAYFYHLDTRLKYLCAKFINNVDENEVEVDKISSLNGNEITICIGFLNPKKIIHDWEYNFVPFRIVLRYDKKREYTLYPYEIKFIGVNSIDSLILKPPFKWNYNINLNDDSNRKFLNKFFDQFEEVSSGKYKKIEF